MAREGPICILKTGETLPPVKAARDDFESWIAEGLEIPLEDLLVCAVYAGDSLPDAESIAGVVVTGSPLMVTDRADWSEASAMWLARLVEGDAMPILGVCYGHQLIAHGLGGDVGANPRGREMGTVEVRIEGPGLDSDPLFEAESLPAHMSHVESVLVPPSGAEVLARTDLEPHAVLRFGPRQWGTQFHPEFDRDIMQRYVETRREILTTEGLDPDSMVEDAEDAPGARAILGRFARIVRGA